MAKENSFDIVSKVDLSEVTNAINIAMKEIFKLGMILKEVKVKLAYKMMNLSSFLMMNSK